MAARNRYFGWLAAALVAALLAFLSFPADAAFEWAPILNVYANKHQIIGYDTAVSACAETGGYLASEPTEAAHAKDVETGDAVGASTWYAYLGGDTAAFRPPTLQQCSGDVSTNNAMTGLTPMYASVNCVWRWNQGRWLSFVDDQSIPGNQFMEGVGIAFFKTNTWDNPGFAGIANGMSTFFFNETVDGTNAARRPGNFYGRYLILVKNDGAGTETGGWSDGSPTTGYPYISSVYSFSPRPGDSIFDYSGLSLTNFISVCNAPTPVRIRTELSNTTSGLQANWWAIFFAILFVLCLIAFIIIACCQEREDMDEPPEDAPEWAQKQTEDRQELKSYRSQRSFRAYASEEDNEEEDGDDVQQYDNGTPRSSAGSQANSEDANISSNSLGYKEHEYVSENGSRGRR